jgi:hypothetical protein
MLSIAHPKLSDLSRSEPLNRMTTSNSSIPLPTGHFMNVAQFREFAPLESKQQLNDPVVSEQVRSLHRIKSQGPRFTAKIRVWGAMTENLNHQSELLLQQTA